MAIPTTRFTRLYVRGWKRKIDMHKGKKCKLNQPNSKKIRMEKRKPNKGYVSSKKGK